MENLKLKVCGMKHNVAEVAELQPDYLGFIFYDGSKRNYHSEEIPSLPFAIKKVGVFVNASLEEIMKTGKKYNLDIIQLHGEESPNFCASLKEEINLEISTVDSEQFKSDEYFFQPEIWKVFSIKDNFDFEILKSYESLVEKFLFDTKGKNKGGNGFTFNWEILKNYISKTPFILSGGIGIEEVENIKEVLKWNLPIYGIDVNSKFETAPGLKNIDELKKFKNEL